MKEIREWVQFIFIIIGGLIALSAYFQNLRQRKVENALKFIGLFKDGLEEGDMDHWKKLFHNASEPAGCPIGQYADESGNCVPIDTYFMEGSDDGGAIARMAESLDVVCHQVVNGAADAQTVYYELGQLIVNYNLWLHQTTPTKENKELDLYNYPSIAKFMKLYGKKSLRWPSRVITFLE